MAVVKHRATLVGTTGLVFHNNQCVDKDNPYTVAKGRITSKGKRATEADRLELKRLEFVSGMYWDQKLGPYVPGSNIRKMLIEGARKEKMGKQFESGIFIPNDVPVQYEGPRDIEAMWKDGRYTWTTVAGNQSASILRTRPRFKEWVLQFEILREDMLVSEDALKSALTISQVAVGLCDARSIGYGRFKVEEFI